jgi:hypothetical protein
VLLGPLCLLAHAFTSNAAVNAINSFFMIPRF